MALSTDQNSSVANTLNSVRSDLLQTVQDTLAQAAQHGGYAAPGCARRH